MKRTEEQQKGHFYYMPYQTKIEIIKTISFFAISLALLLLGIYSTGSKNNLLTVVAVLGLLPSSKSLVNMIMFLRTPKFSEDLYNRIKPLAEPLDAVYALALTSYEGTYPIDCFVVRGQNLILLTSQKTMKTASCESHVQSMLKKDNFHNMTVKVFTEEAKFCNRVAQLAELESNGNEAKIMDLMCNISL